PHRGHLGAGDVVTCAPRFTPRPIELERYPSSLTTPTVPMPVPCALTRTRPANHTEGGPLMGLRDFTSGSDDDQNNNGGPGGNSGGFPPLGGLGGGANPSANNDDEVKEMLVDYNAKFATS